MTDNSPRSLPVLQHPELDSPLGRLADHLVRVPSTRIPLGLASGRVLHESLRADRDSPAADVSAMDGYALRLADLAATAPLPILGRSLPGHVPPSLPPLGHVVQIFTGAVVPRGFELVLRREDTVEHAESIELTDHARGARFGENIRRQGENAKAGAIIIPEGTRLAPQSIAAAANFGAAFVSVAERLRITIITTGDELLATDSGVEAWQLRDSNGPTLAALFGQYPWIDTPALQHVPDDPETLMRSLEGALESSHAVILTGGVSAGDFDYVPATIQRIQGTTVFHKLPIRPGKPILGAVSKTGKLILGLPGNPVSAAVCALRFGLPLLATMTGATMPDAESRPRLTLSNPDTKTLPLHWFRLVRIESDGTAHLVPTRGSGDLVSLAVSTGFIHIPPQSQGPGPWTYWSWS